MIYLLKPQAGQLHVPANTEILLSFQDVDPWPEGVDITVDNDPAVRGGQTMAGWETTRRSFGRGCGRWGLRCVEPLPARDIMVQASVGDTRSHNERFFVQGAQTHHTDRRPDGVIVKTWHPAGWFFVSDGTWQTPFGRFEADTYKGTPHIHAGDTWMVYWPSHGILQTSDGRSPPTSRDVPAVSADADVAMKDGQVVAADSEVRTITDGVNWGFGADCVAIDDGMIHARVGKTSFHLPVDYEPAPGEQTLESWYFVGQQDTDGQIKLEAGMGLWWTDEKMSARHDFSPITQASDDMLWLSEDIDQPFRDVTIIDGSHVVVNDQLLLNTRHPDIQPL